MVIAVLRVVITIIAVKACRGALNVPRDALVPSTLRVRPCLPSLSEELSRTHSPRFRRLRLQMYYQPLIDRSLQA